MGLSYGSTVCMLSCAPVVTPLLIGNNSSLRASFGSVAIFSLGRIFSYSLIAFLSSYASFSIKNFLNQPILWGRTMGVFMMLTSLYLLYKAIFGDKMSCSSSCKTSRYENLGKSGYFFMGVFLSFGLCAPVLSLIAFSANSTSPMVSAIYGILFGMGAVLFSLLFFGFFLSVVTQGVIAQFSKYKKAIQVFSALMLFSISIAVFSGSIKL